MTNDLETQLDRDYAPAWRPEPGDSFIGTVVELSEREGNYGSYPIVTMRSASGEERAVHAFHEVLASEFARVAPKIGDELGIKYLGMHAERGYHRYRVRRAGASAELNWDKYGGGGEAGPDVPVGPVDQSIAGRAAAEQDDAIPF